MCVIKAQEYIALNTVVVTAVLLVYIHFVSASCDTYYIL